MVKRGRPKKIEGLVLGKSCGCCLCNLTERKGYLILFVFSLFMAIIAAARDNVLGFIMALVLVVGTAILGRLAILSALISERR